MHRKRKRKENQQQQRQQRIQWCNCTGYLYRKVQSFHYRRRFQSELQRSQSSSSRITSSTIPRRCPLTQQRIGQEMVYQNIPRNAHGACQSTCFRAWCWGRLFSLFLSTLYSDGAYAYKFAIQNLFPPPCYLPSHWSTQGLFILYGQCSFGELALIWRIWSWRSGFAHDPRKSIT